MNRSICATLVFAMTFILASVSGYAQKEDLGQQVSAALTMAKHQNFAAIHSLAEQGAAVVPYLKQHASDSNPFVRDAIVNAAAGIPTPDARNLLVFYVADKEDFVGRDAVKCLDRTYSAQEVVGFGGQALKNNLMHHVQQDSVYAKGILMLGQFSAESDAAQFLQDLRLSRPNGKVQLSDGQLASLPVCVDLALSATNGRVEVNSVLQDIQSGQPDDLLFILTALKYVDNRAILSNLVELLKDKRETAQAFGIAAQVPKGSAPLPPNPHLRVCDLALMMLAQKTRVDVGVPDVVAAVRTSPFVPVYRNFSDLELSRASARLRSQIQVEHP